MDDMTPLVQPEQIEQAILLIRGQRVMLDRDLAALYGVTTSNLNKAVKRNLDRFPADFMFQLTLDEAQAVAGSRFQIGILKQGQNIKYLPHVFTQEGVAMLSSVLRSPRAVQVNIAIMRVFVRLRETLSLHKDLAHKLAQLERKIEGHEGAAGGVLSRVRGEGEERSDGFQHVEARARREGHGRVPEEVGEVHAGAAEVGGLVRWRFELKVIHDLPHPGLLPKEKENHPPLLARTCDWICLIIIQNNEERECHSLSWGRGAG
jgi:hypothetical protein